MRFRRGYSPPVRFPTGARSGMVPTFSKEQFACALPGAEDILHSAFRQTWKYSSSRNTSVPENVRCFLAAAFFVARYATEQPSRSGAALCPVVGGLSRSILSRSIWWANRLCRSTVNSTRYGRTLYGGAMTRSRIANLTRSEFVLSPNSSMILYLWKATVLGE